MTTTPLCSSTVLCRSLWVWAFVLGLAFASRVCADDTDARGEHFATIVVPSGLAAGDVQDAIVATLLGREWGVRSKADGQVVGYLRHRGNEATVTMTYDTSKVDIYCVGYEIDKSTGAREKPDQPKNWLKYLQNDLMKNLNKAITHK